jgi:two-component system copper resistance phosphate regulon response regulator CusR
MRVLVVEDDHELGAAIAAGLRSVGFAVDLAGNARDAEFKVEVNRYDCLVVDRGLPDGDGLAMVRRLRAAEADATGVSAARVDAAGVSAAGVSAAGVSVPVLVLTARDAVADRLLGFADGADDYLTKPFALAELAARVGALCRRAQHPRPVLIRVADLEVDLARRRVRRGGVLLAPTAKEFAVLELLAARAGQVVTRGQLIECCWDEMAEPVSNVVDAVIAQLRRKLGCPQLIMTVRGVGFVLTEPAADRAADRAAGRSRG